MAQCDALWTLKTIKISVDYVVAENRRIDVFLRHGWEGRLLSLIGKSKLLLIVLIHWYGVQAALGISSCLLSAGAVLIVPVKILHLKQQLRWESPPDEVYNS